MRHKEMDLRLNGIRQTVSRDEFVVVHIDPASTGYVESLVPDQLHEAGYSWGVEFIPGVIYNIWDQHMEFLVYSKESAARYVVVVDIYYDYINGVY